MLLINLVAIALRHAKGGKHGTVCRVEQALNFAFVTSFYNIKSNQGHFVGFSDPLGYCVGSMSFRPEASSDFFLSTVVLTVMNTSTVGSVVSSKTCPPIVLPSGLQSTACIRDSEIGESTHNVIVSV